MGREANCTCDWAGVTTEVKALLETGELILRGGIRKRIPFSALKSVKATGDRLSCTVDGAPVQLILGPAASKWAMAITSPAPTLASKLGITGKTSVRTIGDCSDETLREALAEAVRFVTKDADLIVACVDSPASLDSALRQTKTQLLKGVPIWMVYPKGPGYAVNEASIRSLLREIGMIDTKVASVSAKYTALRFILSKPD